MKWSLMLAFLAFLTIQPNAKPKEMFFELRWAPGDSLNEYKILDLKNLGRLKAKVLPVVDERDNKDNIGQNTEKKSPRIYQTPSNIADWSTRAVKLTLKAYGVKIVEENPDIIIRPTLLRFYVNEADVYKGNVALRIAIENPEGISLWEGVTNGRSTRWGSSFSEENYLECICNSFADAMYNLLKEGSLISSL